MSDSMNWDAWQQSVTLLQIEQSIVDLQRIQQGLPTQSQQIANQQRLVQEQAAAAAAPTVPMGCGKFAGLPVGCGKFFGLYS
ncbi:MAG: hypothetical protein WCJ35_13230 [Planctomycetota bacterium]